MGTNPTKAADNIYCRCRKERTASALVPRICPKQDSHEQQRHPDHVLLRKSTTLRMKKNLRRVAEKYKKYEVSFDYCKQVAASYAGMLEHVDGNRFKDKLWEDFVLTHNMEE